VLQLDGIEYVQRLRLARQESDGRWTEVETVELPAWVVPELAAIQVVEASQPLPAPQDNLQPPPSGPVVPVPVIRDLC